MAITRLYISDPAFTQGEQDQLITLPKASAHHAINVLRMKRGDHLQLFDGEGVEWLSELEELSKKEAQVRLIEPVNALPESPLRTHLGIALFRSDRFDYALQKAVELGITSITPLITDYVSVKQNKQHLEKREQHWRNIIIAACEQSRRSYLPKLQAITTFHQWVSPAFSEGVGDNNPSGKFILHPPMDQCDPVHATIQSSIPATSHATPKENIDILFMTGPEGGFSDQEYQQSVQNGFNPINLGGRILRAETAPLAFLSILQALLGDI